MYARVHFSMDSSFLRDARLVSAYYELQHFVLDYGNDHFSTYIRFFLFCYSFLLHDDFIQFCMVRGSTIQSKTEKSR